MPLLGIPFPPEVACSLGKGWGLIDDARGMAEKGQGLAAQPTQHRERGQGLPADFSGQWGVALLHGEGQMSHGG